MDFNSIILWILGLELQVKIYLFKIYVIFVAYLVRYVLFYSSVKYQTDPSYSKRVINFLVSKFIS